MKESMPPVQEAKREETACSQQACHNCFENNGCMYYHHIISDVHAIQATISPVNNAGQEQPVLIW